MAEYFVKTRIEHNGKPYEIGSPIKMEEEAGNRLVANGVLVTPEDHAADVALKEAQAKAAINRDRVGLPPVKPEETKPIEPQEGSPAKPITPEDDGEVNQDKVGDEDEQSKEDGNDL